MKRRNRIFSYHSLERLSKKWWIYLLLALIPAVTPPITAAGCGYLLNIRVFIDRVYLAMYLKKLLFTPYLPLLHLAVIILLFVLFLARNKISRIFPIIVGIHFLFMLYVQAYVITREYGLVIVSEIFIWYLIVALFWFWEAVIVENDYSFSALRLKHAWILPLVLLAFWNPEQTWNLDPYLFVDSYSPTAFCMMVPIYLAVLRFQYPAVNIPLFRMTSFLGLLIGIITIGIAFFQNTRDGIYWILLHIPLLAISLHCFIISIKPQNVSVNDQVGKY